MIDILKKYAQLIIGLGFLFYFFYTLSNALGINQNLANATWLAGVIYMQSVGEFLYFYRKYGKPRLQDWLRLMIFVMLVMNFMSIVNSANGALYVPFVGSSLSLIDSPFAMMVIVVALIALDIAYFIGKVVWRRKNYYEQHLVMRKNVVFAILILSTIFKGYLLFAGFARFGVEVKDASGLVSLVNMLSTYLNPFALIVSAYILFNENSTNKGYKTVFYSVLVVQVLLGTLSGMKENAIAPIMFTLIVFFLAGRKLPKNFVVIGLFFVVLLYPLNNAYRNVIGNPSLDTGSSTLNMAIAIKKVFNEPLSETLLSGAEMYADRGAMFPFLLFTIQDEYRWDYYKNMNRYWTLPLAWIVPRLLWEDKPRTEGGGVLYELITGVRTMTAVTPTSLGWAYFEGGVFFVFTIFLLVGLIYEFVDRKNMRKPIVLVFYAALLHFAIKPEWDPYFMISSLVPMFIIYWLLLKIVGMRRVQS